MQMILHMKNLIFIFLFLSTNAFSEIISDLGYKAVFRTFYPTIFHVSMDDDNYEGSKLPRVGIKENGKEYLALMHPIQEYKNAFGEERYLLFIEKREIGKNEYQLVNGKWEKINSLFYGFSNTCHACYAKADLRIFKKNQSNQYQLISTSQKDYETNGGYGVADLDISDLKNKVKRIGESKVGFFNTSSDLSYGVETKSLNLVVLDENQIQDYTIDIVGSDDSGRYTEFSPLSHTLTSEWYIDESKDGKPYYPINIKFMGDTYDEESEKIIDYNKINIYQFNSRKNGFELTSSQNY